MLGHSIWDLAHRKWGAAEEQKPGSGVITQEGHGQTRATTLSLALSRDTTGNEATKSGH